MGLATLTLLAACSSSERVGSASVPGGDSSLATSSTTDTTTSAVPTTTAPTATIAVTSTSAAPPVTPAPTVAPALPLLLGDGIGTASFGDGDDAVLALLTPAFGGVATDTSETFDVNVGVDSWQSSDGELQYTAPIARKVCFGNQVCTVFGGASAGDLAFTGWFVDEGSGPTAQTIEGIRQGDTWASHFAAITRLPGGCYSYGSATSLDGISIGMISSGELFNFYDDSAGTWSDGFPDPAAVTIVDLSAGDLVISLFADC